MRIILLFMKGSCMHGNRTLTTIQSLWHQSMMYKSLINAGWITWRERIRPLQRAGRPAQAAQPRPSLYSARGFDVVRWQKRKKGYGFLSTSYPRQALSNMCVQWPSRAGDACANSNLAPLVECRQGPAYAPSDILPGPTRASACLAKPDSGQ